MASDNAVIIKRVKKASHDGHHGGAWKVAYADFVTAMMAFFLLMWLLGSTTKAQRQGIADYFKTPLKVAMSGGEGSGDASSIIKGGGKDLTHQTGQIKRGDEPSRKVINLQAARADGIGLADRFRDVGFRENDGIGQRAAKSQVCGDGG